MIVGGYWRGEVGEIRRPIRFGPPPRSDEEIERENVEWLQGVLAAIERMPKMGAVLRLKMSIGSVKRVCDQNGNQSSEEVTLQAVYGDAGSANAQWSKWTPAASLTMTITNPGAFGKVLPGQFFFVDLIATDKDAL